MATSYVYSITSDFTNATEVDVGAFQVSINADATVSVDVDYINSSGDSVEIFFPSALSTPQKTQLDVLVANYVFVAIPPRSVSSSRAAVVSKSTSHPGDYSSIAAAFAAGEQSVYVKNGLYVEVSDIIIPDYGQLVGESLNVVVYLAAGNKIISDGSGGTKETAGTISITKDTDQVIGIGTSFTNLSIGQFILVGTNYLGIIAIASDTVLTIEKTYRGKSVSGSTYIAQAMNTAIYLENIITTSSSSNGLYMRAIRHSSINSITSNSCTNNILIEDCGDISVTKIVSAYSTGIGVEIKNSVSISCGTINTFDCSGDGVMISGECVNVCLGICASENNGGCGIHIDDTSHNIKLSNCITKLNSSHGIHSTSSNFNITADDCDMVDNGGWGAVMHGTYNHVCDCVVSLNTLGGICITSENIIENNQVKDNGGNGIEIKAGSMYCNIACNRIQGSGGHGISTGDCEVVLVMENTISGSSGHGITMNGEDAHAGDNIVIGSTSNGIDVGAASVNASIKGNRIKTSTGDGLKINTGAVDTIAVNNNLKGNTGTSLVDNGTTTITTDNKT